jgi:hypothetical protein
MRQYKIRDKVSGQAEQIQPPAAAVSYLLPIPIQNTSRTPQTAVPQILGSSSSLRHPASAQQKLVVLLLLPLRLLLLLLLLLLMSMVLVLMLMLLRKLPLYTHVTCSRSLQ